MRPVERYQLFDLFEAQGGVVLNNFGNRTAQPKFFNNLVRGNTSPLYQGDSVLLTFDHFNERALGPVRCTTPTPGWHGSILGPPIPEAYCASLSALPSKLPSNSRRLLETETSDDLPCPRAGDGITRGLYKAEA
jgi:hypothetical protein